MASRETNSGLKKASGTSIKAALSSSKKAPTLPPSKNQSGSSDRTARCVFVGNISYEVSEEQLKKVFSQAGPVLHLRLVYDRESGKPKGYGFCEFHDSQTAESAIRNLNGYELNGRALRVDSSASGERNNDETLMLQAALATQQAEQNAETPYGPPCDPERAPEIISRVVASLPPEQLLELIRQMKQCIINTPNEAEHMLMENGQLAYALLQALVVMRAVDVDAALSMLHQGEPGITGAFHSHSQAASGKPSLKEQSQTASTGYPKSAAILANAKAELQASSDDQQQAQLLMQVLQLSEEQIALLPPDDRRKVIELRNQLSSV